jgi:hypothetical protein
MRVEMVLLDAPGFFRIAAEEPLNVGAHPLIDEIEQPGGCRIKTVVEVENPVSYVIEARVHGDGSALTRSDA